MIYTVGWLQSAEDALTDLWINASDRAAISAASNAIDRKLRIDANRQGVPIPGGRRLLRVPPLAVAFTVDPAEGSSHSLTVTENSKTSGLRRVREGWE
jgi:hypothetical protein